MRKLAPAALVVLALAGCGGGSGSAPKAAAPTAAATTLAPTTEASTPTPSPTPTTLSRSEAAATYLRLVKPVNTAIDAASHIPPRVGQAVILAKHLLAANHAFAIGLEGSAWPADVRPVIDRLLNDVTAEQPLIRDMAKATSRDAYVSAANVWGSKGSKHGADAELARVKLGLPTAS